MARLNVEDAFFSDPRFRLLVKLVGDEDKAAGLCLRAWFLGQKYWSKAHKTIPDTVWKAAELEPLVAVDLAEKRADGVYVRGSSKQFDWLLGQKRAAAGVKSAKARKEKYGTAQPNKLEQKAEQKSGCSEVAANTPELSLLSSPSSLLSSQENADVAKATSVSTPTRRRAPDPRVLVEIWNANKAPNQPAVELKAFTHGSPRWRKAQARLGANPPAYWEEVVKRIAASSFCRGEVDSRDGRKPWVAGFDFLVKPETHVKVLEGRYDDPDAAGGKSAGDLWLEQHMAKHGGKGA